MKKIIFFISTILLIVLISCSQKKENNLNLSQYEGKIVQSTTGQWYLIKNGCRWRTNSIEATDNYLKKMPVGPNYVEKNVSVEILHNFPEAGELLPKVVFKKDH